MTQVIRTTTTTKAVNGKRARRSRTSWATDARKAAYDAAVRNALPTIREAQRNYGVYNAALLANWLNVHSVPTANGNEWNKASMLRALHRLKQLKLHAGPRPARKARSYPVNLWSEAQRIIAMRKVKARNQW